MDGKTVASAFKSAKWDANTVNRLVDEIVSNPNYALAAIGVAILVLLLTISLVKLLSGSSSSGNAILLVGLSDSGKTVLFTRLLTNKFVQTLTSMKQNQGEVSVGKNKTVPVYDLPGFERLRNKFWDDYKEKAKGIIFVVDSLLFLSNIRDVAEFLYTVLSDPLVNKRKIPILVACNKQDEAKAKAAKVIQNQLEKEINTIRETRGAALGSTDASSDNGDVMLGSPGRDFQYSDLKMPIEFVNCSALANGDDDGHDQLADILKWMLKRA